MKTRWLIDHGEVLIKTTAARLVHGSSQRYGLRFPR
jgi:hypothetical protein